MPMSANSLRRISGLILVWVALTIPSSTATAHSPLGAQQPPPNGGKHRFIHEAFRSGGWRLSITRNTFSGGIACRVKAKDGKALYRMDAVGFSFPRGWDVSNAVYRVDGAAPHRSRGDLPELIARNAPVDRGPSDHAAQGIVWIPYEALQTTRAVTIQPRPDKSPRVRTRWIGQAPRSGHRARLLPEHSFVE
jgi:hypothetical protein